MTESPPPPEGVVTLGAGTAAVAPIQPTEPAFGRVVALLGAESTGKTTLARALCARLSHRGLRATVVSEYLREFCDAHGRTPTQQEQWHIAQEQTRRIAQAAADHDWVIADTTAVMTALYSEWVFEDTGLYENAWAAHRSVTLTLVTALDLPWVADGIQRDSPRAQQRIDVLLRSRLERAALPFGIVSGQGDLRLQSAVRAWEFAQQGPKEPAEPQRKPWRHLCQFCDDPDCERQHWLAGRAAG